jgi:transposase-like protein
MPAPYPLEFRREAVALLRSSGKSVPQLASAPGAIQRGSGWLPPLEEEQQRHTGRERRGSLPLVRVERASETSPTA